MANAIATGGGERLPSMGFVQHQRSIINPGSFDRAFRRQQQILQTRNDKDIGKCMGQTHKSAPAPNSELRQFEGGMNLPTNRPLSSSPAMQQLPTVGQLSKLQRELQQQQQQLQQTRQQQGQRDMLYQQQQQALAVQKLLGVNTSSSQNHSLIITNALNALKSCNDQALLKAMMPSESTTEDNATESCIRAAVSERLQQLRNENANTNQSGLASSPIPPRHLERSPRGMPPSIHNNMNTHTQGMSQPQDTNYSLMLAQMRKLDRANQQRIAGIESTGMINKVSKLQGQLPPSEVARLYNEISAMQRLRRQQHGTLQASHLGGGGELSQQQQQPQNDAKKKYPRPVRRASAA
jgi:hypothetical protein